MSLVKYILKENVESDIPKLVVGGNFSCWNNQLTSLQGAPTEVGGHFFCKDNPNLSKDEILKYKATGAVKGTIVSDYGDF